MLITRTPFRISFFGGGTDYPVWFREHGGAVLSTSIDKYCYVTVRDLPPLFPYKYRIRYTISEEASGIDDIKHPSVKACLSFLKLHDRPLEMQHNADIPAMTGLGSSSAFTVGFLNALHNLQGNIVNKEMLAYDAIHVEQNLIGENVGSQDQVAAAFGGFNRVDFLKDGKITVRPAFIDEAVKKELQKNLMLVYVGQARVASEIAAAQIKNTPNKVSELKTMQAMVPEAESIFKKGAGHLGDFGRLLGESWKIKRTLSAQIANSVVDGVYKEAVDAGALGGKLLGAGGGGFLLLYAEPEAQKIIKEKLKKFPSVGFNFEDEGSRVIYKMN